MSSARQRRLLAAVLVPAALLLSCPETARADGIMWEAPQARDLAAEEAQQAWLEWRDGRERLVVAVAPGSVSKHLAWLLPVPAPAKHVRLALAGRLPSWAGREVRAAARLELSPLLVFFYFLFFFLLAGGCGTAAVTMGIILVLSAISIGPGPGTARLSDMEVRTSGRVELAGLASELAQAPSVEAFERYLKAKSCVLPAPARGLVSEHIRSGNAFIVSWAAAPKIGQTLAVEAEFPSAKPWYPARLTSAYGKARIAVDLRAAGWLDPDFAPGLGTAGAEPGRDGGHAGAYSPLLLGYYDGTPDRHTRFVFQGAAERLSRDWTFSPARRAWSLRLAAFGARHGLLFDLLIVLLCSLPFAVLAGGIAYPDWRNGPGLAKLALVGASGVLPVLGPVKLLGWLRPSSSAEPKPAPKPPRAWPVHGVALALAGAVVQALGLGWNETGLGQLGFVAGTLAAAAGVAVIQVRRGGKGLVSVLAGLVMAAFLPVLGPVIGMFMDSKTTIGESVKAAPLSAADRQARAVAMAAAAGALLLYFAVGYELNRLWSLDRATATIVRSHGGFRDLIRKSNEGATKGNLGAIRSALSLYRGAHRGRYPGDLAELTAGSKYLPAIPPAKPANWHPASSEVHRMTGAQFAAGEFPDAGGWAYVVDGPSSGSVWVDCTHTDTKGSAWIDY